MPHEISAPHPSANGPHVPGTVGQASGVHVRCPHMLGVPPPPHVSGGVHVPHDAIDPPQPSAIGPHAPGVVGHASGTHVGRSGVMHDVRSKSKNSSTFSCGVIVAGSPHSSGNLSAPDPPVLTWKSENITRPHCASGAAPTGVLNVNWRGLSGLSAGSANIQS